MGKCADCGKESPTIFISGTAGKGRCLNCDALFVNRKYWAQNPRPKKKSILQELEEEERNRDKAQTTLHDWVPGQRGALFHRQVISDD